MSRLLSAGFVRAACAVILCSVAASVVAPTDAFAQSDEASKAKRVLSLIGGANEKFDAEDFAGALADYKEAYELYPDPSLLYRIGLSSEKLGDNFEAVEYYAKFIDAVPDDKTAKKVRARIDELRAALPARYQVESSPAEAAVRLDDLNNPIICTTPCEIDVPAGRATIIVSKAGYDDGRRVVTAESGARSRAEFELSETIELASTDPGPTATSEGSGLAMWGWIATGVGVAALGTGAAFTVLSQSAADDVNSYDKRGPGASPGELQGLKDDATSYYDTSVIMYVVGGVLTATGVTLVVVDSVSSDGSASLRVSPTAGGALVGVGGRF
ncbi:MAG: PEGA domain-containing protein [bacterium]